MSDIFATQRELVESLGLTKVRAVRNENYKAHGTKSYVYLLHRFGFQPTKPGPYRYINRVHQRGLAGFKVAVGGRAHVERVLFRHALADDGGKEGGQVTADDQQNDSMYLCEVDIGTPSQKLSLDFDTGSSDLWVFSSGLPSDLHGSHNIFDSSKSSTFKEAENQSWKIAYGDGSSASGDVGTDTVNIGGLAIKGQSVELATKLAEQFARGTGDGLLGLAFPSINTIKTDNEPDPQPTPVANMISNNIVPKDAQLFTSCFYSEREQGKESFYTFGFIDEDLVKASGKEILWTDIDNSQGFWMFPSTTASIAGQQVTQSDNKAIADTGTTLALVSDQVCDALYKAIPGAKYDESQQGYLIPSNTSVDQLPEFSIAVGDNTFVISKEDLLFAKVDDNNWYGGVQSRGENPFDILGLTFLKSVYAIWDQGKTRFGAVPKSSGN